MKVRIPALLLFNGILVHRDAHRRKMLVVRHSQPENAVMHAIPITRDDADADADACAVYHSSTMCNLRLFSTLNKMLEPRRYMHAFISSSLIPSAPLQTQRQQHRFSFPSCPSSSYSHKPHQNHHTSPCPPSQSSETPQTDN